MIRLAFEQIRHRLGRTLALGLGVLVSTASFTVLTGAAQTSRLEVRGSVSRNFRAAYDLLVRPPGSATPLEREQGLVRGNATAGLPGGITTSQYAAVRRLPGVEVVAPVANIGYVLLRGTVDVPMARYLTGAGRQLFRIRPTWVSDRGRSRYVGAPHYVYVSRAAVTVVPFDRVRAGKYGLRTSGAFAERVPAAPPVPVCANYLFDQEASVAGGDVPWTAFGYRSPYSELGAPLTCYFTRLRPPRSQVALIGASDAARIVAPLEISVPVALAAVDPEAEDRLVGLETATTSGRALRAADRLGADSRGNPVVPVVAANRSFVDLQVTATVERVTSPPGGLPAVFGSDVGAVARVARLASTPVGTLAATDAAGVYRGISSASVFGYWIVGDATYDAGPHLQVRRAHNPPITYSVYSSDSAAPGSDDVQLRPVQVRSLDNTQFRLPQLKVVGRFAPERLRVPGRLTGASSETYLPVELVGANAASRQALGGRILQPNGNLAGYPAQPPLLLTSLAAARVFSKVSLFPDDERAGAQIGVLRVRVAGVHGPDPLSRERIKRVALAITERTGLEVDVVTGASGVRLVVDLPAGSHGRPALALTETWSKKGVAVAVLRAADRKSLVLFALILLVCSLLVANAAAAAVRSRRRELGVLSCLGWSGRKLFGVVLVELGAVGLAAGLVGALLALPLAALAGVEVSPARALLSVPGATLLASLAGLRPAQQAARAVPLDAVRPVVRMPRRGRAVRRPTGLALAFARRSPGRVALAVASVAIGITALAMLLDVADAFRGAVTGTLLGDAVTVEVRRPDVVAVTVVLLLAGAVVADVLWLSVRERAAEYAALAALGWGDRALAGLVVREAAVIGVLGGVVGCGLAAAAVQAFTGEVPRALLLPTVLAALVSVGVACAAALAPVVALRRLPIASILSGE